MQTIPRENLCTMRDKTLHGSHITVIESTTTQADRDVLSRDYGVGRFIPDDFLILITAFMYRGSVTYKNPVYFFFRRKKISRGRAAGKSVKNASFS
jgi:hypothetical protein